MALTSEDLAAIKSLMKAELKSELKPIKEKLDSIENSIEDIGKWVPLTNTHAANGKDKSVNKRVTA